MFDSIPSYFSHGLICPKTLVGEYNKVYNGTYLDLTYTKDSKEQRGFEKKAMFFFPIYAHPHTICWML